MVLYVTILSQIVMNHNETTLLFELQTVLRGRVIKLLISLLKQTFEEKNGFPIFLHSKSFCNFEQINSVITQCHFGLEAITWPQIFEDTLKWPNLLFVTLEMVHSGISYAIGDQQITEPKMAHLIWPILYASYIFLLEIQSNLT